MKHDYDAQWQAKQRKTLQQSLNALTMALADIVRYHFLEYLVLLLVIVFSLISIFSVLVVYVR